MSVSVELLQQIRAFPVLSAPARSRLLESIRNSSDPQPLAELIRVQHNIAFELCKMHAIGRHPLICFALLARVGNKAEATLVVNLLLQIKTQWVLMGRDFIRMLQGLSLQFAIEFKPIWDVVMGVDSSEKLVIELILEKPTPFDYLKVLVPFDIERKLKFMAEFAKNSVAFRYEKWFEEQHVNLPGCEALLPEIVRLIVGITPLNSGNNESISRSSLIAWVFRLSKNPSVMGAMYMNLFYDWLFFNDLEDSISRIEPALLLMAYSIQKNVNLSQSCLDFLCKITKSYRPSQLQVKIQKCISAALVKVLDLKVLPTLSFIINAPGIDEKIREESKRIFPVFTSPIQPISSDSKSALKRSAEQIPPTSASPLKMKKVSADENPSNLVVKSPQVAKVPLDAVKLESPTSGVILDEFKSSGLNAILLREIQEVYNAGISIQQETTTSPLEAIKFRTSAIIRNVANHAAFLTAPFLQTTCKAVSKAVTTHFSYGAYFKSDLLDALFSFRIEQKNSSLTSTDEQNIRANLFTQLRLAEVNLGWHFLNFAVDQSESESVNLYLLYLVSLSKAKDKTCLDCFLEDLENCRICCFERFDTLCLKSLQKHQLKNYTSEISFLKLIASAMAPSQVSRLCESLESREIELFPSTALQCAKILGNTMSWEGFDQILIWRLFSSQILLWSDFAISDVVIELLKLIEKESADKYIEAASGILQVLSFIKPTPLLIHHVLCLSKPFKTFVWRAAGRIIREYPKEFIEACLVQLKLSINLPLSPTISDSQYAKRAQQLNLNRTSPEEKKMIISRSLANISSIRDTSDSEAHLNAIKLYEKEIQQVLLRISQKSEFVDLIRGARLDDMISKETSAQTNVSNSNTESEIQYEGWDKL